MSARMILAVASFLLALTGTAAFACGVCIEDRIATVYDHAVVTQALGQGRHIAFFALDGTLAPGAGTGRMIEDIANSIEGVDKGSARVSVELAALSVAFDPRRLPNTALQAELQRKLTALKLSALPLRVIDGPGMMKTTGTE